MTLTILVSIVAFVAAWSAHVGREETPATAAATHPALERDTSSSSHLTTARAEPRLPAADEQVALLRQQLDDLKKQVSERDRAKVAPKSDAVPAEKAALAVAEKPASLQAKESAKRAVVESSDAPVDLPTLIEAVEPAVVQINCVTRNGTAIGSGFIVDRLGTIITNYHVVENAQSAEAVLPDGTKLPVIGYLDLLPKKDLALLKVDPHGRKLRSLAVAHAPVRKGERVAAFGSPLGFSKSVSDGIVSAVRRGAELPPILRIDSDATLIQTTAPISHGNSGGPLVNMKGEVVGVNTLTFQSFGENINFAVSSNDLLGAVAGCTGRLLPVAAVRSGPSRVAQKVEVRTLRSIVGARPDDRGDLGRKRAAAGQELQYELRQGRQAVESEFAHLTMRVRSRMKKEGISQDEAQRQELALVFATHDQESEEARAIACYNKGDFDGCIFAMRAVIRSGWGSRALAVYYCGMAYLWKGDTAKAFAHLDYLSPNPSRLTLRYGASDDSLSAAVVFSRGLAYLADGEYDKALADLAEAIRLAPAYADAYFYRGQAYVAKGDVENGITSYSEAIGLDPGLLTAYISRGSAYLEARDWQRAIADFTEAARLDPKCALAFYGRGNSYSLKGELDKAIADYTEAIRVDPSLVAAYGCRGEVYARKGELDSAIADFSDTIRLGPKDALAYSVRGRAYRIKGELDKAIADYTEAIRLDPKDARTYHDRGWAYGKKDDWDKAIADCTAAIGLDPKLVVAYYTRGVAYEKKGEWDKVIADCTEAIRLDPKLPAAYCNRGWAYGKKGEWDKAITDDTEAIRLDPKLAPAYYGRGNAYKQGGKETKANEDFAKAKELGYKPEK
jgi:tetratricopeptide (TPR) repeat protein/S1-C subfamily serine protease